MKKIVPVIYAGLCFISFLAIFLSWFGTRNIFENQDMQTIAPYKIEQVSEWEKDLYLDMSANTFQGMDIAFFTNHQQVEVFADGRQIYTSKIGKTALCNTSGSIWNIVEIPADMHQVVIKLTAIYECVENPEITVYYGRTLELYQSIMADSLSSALISILLVFVGVLFMFIWFIVQKRTLNGRMLLYLGLFSILFGLWSFEETDAAVLMFTNRASASVATYIFLMLMGIPTILFVREFTQIRDKYVWKILCLLSVIDFVVCVGLQAAGIKAFKETIGFTQGVLVCAVLYLLGSIIYKICRHQFEHTMVVNLAGMALLVASMMIDLACYYSGIHDTDRFGRIGFFLFTLLLGGQVAINTLHIIDRGRKAQIYRELAITDTLTGQLNRNAYGMELEKAEKLENVMIVTFDLNNLKQCNDTLGHMCGDKYIIKSAEIIQKVFSEYGSCYRIGGDEFCVIIEDAANCPIETLKEKLIEEQKEQNKVLTDITIQIACGYAAFDSGRDADLEATRCRADEMMYQDKRELKAKKELG